MCDLSKVQKMFGDGIPPLRPILLALKTPTYKGANFFASILGSITIKNTVLKSD